jgi:hypothetical protein
MMRPAAVLAGALALCALCAQAAAGAGESTFEVPSPRGAVHVTMYRPSAWTPQSPVWIVMHGRKRDAAGYLARWHPAADRHGALLLVPSFDKQGWPTSREYPTGDVVDKGGHARPKSEWAFPVVDRAFEEAARRTGSRRTRFVLYGHGAGAQFVQRYVFFMGSRHLERAVAAGAGWYLLPDDQLAYPYGLRGTALGEAALREALAAPLVIVVGANDLKTDGVLRNNPETLAQGATRVDRARFAIERGRERASALHVPFQWRLAVVPGVGHRPADMLPAAERIIAGASDGAPPALH